jgi:hypothetical protein
VKRQFELAQTDQIWSLFHKPLPTGTTEFFDTSAGSLSGIILKNLFRRGLVELNFPSLHYGQLIRLTILSLPKSLTTVKTSKRKTASVSQSDYGNNCLFVLIAALVSHISPSYCSSWLKSFLITRLTCIDLVHFAQACTAHGRVRPYCIPVPPDVKTSRIKKCIWNL